MSTDTRRLWVDDLRAPPAGWVWARSSSEAIGMLKVSAFDAVSLDHDLGGDDTSRRIVLWFCEHDLWPEHVYIHTANPVGREWLEGMAVRYGPGVIR